MLLSIPVMESLQSLLMSFFNVIPALVTLGICGYYYIKSRTPDAILLLVGSGIHMLTSLMYAVVVPILTRTNNWGRVNSIYTLLAIINFVGTVAFVIGLFLLIQKVLEQKENPKSW